MKERLNHLIALESNGIFFTASLTLIFKNMQKLHFVVLTSIILCISIPKTILAQSTDGDALFDVPAIHDVSVTFSQPSFWDSLVAYYPLDKMMIASVTIDGTVMNSIGIQLKGNSSYNSYPGVKKSMKIAFDEYVSQKYDGLKTINLNNSFKDPTMMREKMMLDFCNRNNIPAPRCSYARVYLNGTYWGLYTIVEQVNKTFLTDRFGNNDGNLFKGDPQGSLQWYGSSASSYYAKYELKTNTTANDWSDLVHLIDKINNSSTTVFHDSLETILDSQTFIDVWAANILFANLDSYQGSGHNYYLYHDILDTHFKFIIWDVNEAFGNFQMGIGYPGIENMTALYIPTPSISRPLTAKMLQNITYKNNYVSTLCNYVFSDFDTAHLYPIIDSLANVIRSDVYADPNKMYTNTQFENNINTTVTSGMFQLPGLKSFILHRRNALVTELAGLGCFSGINDIGNYNAGFSLYPNPTNGIVKINSTNQTIQSIKIYSLTSELLHEYFTSEFSIADLPEGIYIVAGQTDNGFFYSKLIKQ